jgi:hypothetical protein
LLAIIFSKVYAFLNSIKYQGHDDMGKWRYSSIIFDLGTTWRWMISFMSSLLHPRGRAPDTHWIGGSVGPRDNLGSMGKRNLLLLSRTEPKPLGKQSTAVLTELSWLPFERMKINKNSV